MLLKKKIKNLKKSKISQFLVSSIYKKKTKQKFIYINKQFNQTDILYRYRPLRYIYIYIHTFPVQLTMLCYKIKHQFFNDLKKTFEYARKYSAIKQNPR